MASINGYTKEEMDILMAALAPLDSPQFTGSPKAVTLPLGEPSNPTDAIATITYVNSLNNTIQALLTTNYARLTSPALSGTPTSPTPAVGDNTTKIATTAFVVASFAPLSSPGFFGSPTAPTQSPGDNSAKLATTGYVDATKLATISLQIATSYTLALTDAKKVIETNNASANTITVPTNATVAFPIGTEIRITQTGAGKTTCAAASGVTINSPGGLLGCRVQWSTIMLRKRATDVWVLSDDVG